MTMHGVRRVLGWYENVLAVAAGGLLILMMAITAVDVVMRYAFHAPLSWGFDLVTQYMLVATFFFSFAIALRMGEHVAVDYFVRSFHPGARRWAMSVAWLACGVLAAAITSIAAHETYQAWRQGEVIAGVIPWPVWVQKAIIAIGMAPLALRLMLLSVGAVPHVQMGEADAVLHVSMKG